jgi:acyl carrier protein
MTVRDQDDSRVAGSARPPSFGEAVALVAAATESVLGHEVGDLLPGDDLLDDVGLDSFGLLELGAELESRIGLVLPESDEPPTVGAFARIVVLATRSAG